MITLKRFILWKIFGIALMISVHLSTNKRDGAYRLSIALEIQSNETTPTI